MSARWREEKWYKNVLSEKLKGGYRLEDIGIDERIILK
jgi:hypothetical protein